jgi:hypothetical protein
MHLFIQKSIKIYLYDEFGEEIGIVDCERDDCLEKVCFYIEENDIHNMRSYSLS